MELERGYICDDEGWVQPTLTVAEQRLDESLEAIHIAQDDDDSLLVCRFDPLEVGRRWVESYGLPE